MSKVSLFRSVPARAFTARAAAVGLLAVAGGGLLTACGSDDSTATSTPTTTTQAAATTTTGAAPTSEEDAAPSTPPGEGSAATAPAEEPEPVPEGYPGPAEVPVTPEGAAFVEALRGNGIDPAGNGEIAVTTADYICQASAEGQDDTAILVFVTAMVGSDASASGTEITPDKAAADARVYVDTARANYCR
ncbi:DUF732 domain-containing protein [Rhodococcus rhodnii]|nr:DUF732 domain-containing protein [Rhodococcus rhodnii]TXG89509.1 DUF732 domain-containing protein [Rhodococcus rhodnii]